jgi:hypothetical protein
LDAHGHEIRNVHIVSANLTDLGMVKTEALYLTGAGVDTTGGLLTTTDGGRVVSAQGAISINPDTGNVAVKSLSAAALSGPLDAQQNTISNAVLQGGSATELTHVSTERMTVGGLRDTTNTGATASFGQRLVFVDATGGLHAQRSADEVVSIAKLSVGELNFQSGEVDFHGSKVKNIVLDSDTFELGPQKLLQAEGVVISKLAQTAVTHGALLTASDQGKIGPLTGITYENGIFDLSTSTLSAADVSAKTLTLSGIKHAPVLSTDADGHVVSSAVLELERLTARSGVTITSKAAVELQGRDAHTLLSVNEKGEMVTVAKPVKNADAAHAATSNIDAQLRDVHASLVSVCTLTVSKATIEDLHLPVQHSETDEPVLSGNVLVQSKVSLVGVCFMTSNIAWSKYPVEIW